MLSYFHSFIDLGLFVAFMGAFGIFTNKRHILLSVICIEMMFYGVNFFLVALSVYLDDIIGELFALFVLTLAAAESALALALITVYFRVYGNVLFSEELFSFYMQSLHFTKYLKNIIPSILYSVHGKEVIIYVSSNNLIKLITFLKKHTTSQIEQLIDLTAVDYPSRKLRFEVIYQFLSITYNQRITISTSVNEGNSLDSITSLYSSAGWYERETWDRFGIYFRNHPDLRRRLTDYGFKGHPLRKDFPVTGFMETRYSDFNKRVVYEKVNLAQEYRLFTLSNNYSFSANLIYIFISP